MSIILNLISFVLIVFGLLFLAVLSENGKSIWNSIDKSKCTQEQIKKVDGFIINVRFLSFIAVLIGIGLIIARIFA